MLSLDDMPIGNGGDNFVPGASQVSSARLCAFLDLAVNLAEEQVLGVVLQRIVRDAKDRPLAFLLFGSAAWKCQDRDRFIGWTPEQREKKLGLLTNNTRFLILPWVQVPELASGTLAAVLRRLSSDWQRKYGHPITLVETFVERDRFAGTAYRAANWKKVGQTTGRTRQDRCYSIQAPVKDIYLYPLGRRFREELAV